MKASNKLTELSVKSAKPTDKLRKPWPGVSGDKCPLVNRCRKIPFQITHPLFSLFAT